MQFGKTTILNLSVYLLSVIWLRANLLRFILSVSSYWVSFCLSYLMGVNILCLFLQNGILMSLIWLSVIIPCSVFSLCSLCWSKYSYFANELKIKGMLWGSLALMKESLNIFPANTLLALFQNLIWNSTPANLLLTFSGINILDTTLLNALPCASKASPDSG